MLRLLGGLSVSLALGFGVPVLAQQTEVGGGLDLGQVDNQAPVIGARYVKEQFGDWNLACVKTTLEKDPCSLLYTVTDGSGAPIAEISLFRIEDDSPAVAGGTIVVPLETLLQAQVRISVDEQVGRRYNYSYCTTLGCIAQIGLSQEDIDQYKKGTQAVLTVVPAAQPDEIIDMPISLKGFTAGFDAVDVVER